ncbi:hypothetical protein KC19_2G286600 [Ceratodon purpureus]|uniref:VWFA domain-containing protein n=1 Tax=Ceratodon purpureus TaxID=3225 RepID=A0A8T0J1W0_CERPU|nr:hypothetical protein KC19_2G286600 [Ceratodon purpureus]
MGLSVGEMEVILEGRACVSGECDCLKSFVKWAHVFCSADLLATCDNPTNCSHDVCAPLLGDKDGLRCMVVNNNKYCSLSGSSNGSCTNMNLDFRQGYVRLAQTTNLKSLDTKISVCSQRALDPLMRDFASLNPSILTRHFFAPMDGTWRVLPGLAQSGDDCRSFEPRGRPWFRTATSVGKVVVVLIDLSASMNKNLPLYLGAGTILDAAKNIATQLLLTLSSGDHVNIVVFNSTSATPLSTSAILVQDHNTTEQLELDPLRLELSKQTVENQSKPSDLSGALQAALLNFDSNPQAAKVILVVTDGVFATLGNVTLPSTNLTGVKVFLYKLPQSDDNNIFLAGNTLVQQLCAVGGHFEPILKNLENPLLALHKYFSYLANLKRILTGGRPQYGYVYQDFEQIGGNIITVTKPAFSDAGDLIGVAGITIYIEVLGNLTDAVTQALRSRITASAYNASTATQVILTAANCSIVNETTYSCGGSINSDFPSNGGLCMKTDMTSTIQDIVCCGVCSVRGSHRLGSKVIAGVAVGSLLGLLVLVFIGVLGWRGYRKRKEKTAEEAERINNFPGDVKDNFGLLRR